jgi:hypothetical protein
MPLTTLRTPAAGAALLADVVSFTFVLTAIVAVAAFNVDLGVVQVLAVMALFGGLRYVAHELRTDADRAAVAHARRLAALRAQSPSRWTVEQRDGLGRRVDSGA